MKLGTFFLSTDDVDGHLYRFSITIRSHLVITLRGDVHPLAVSWMCFKSRWLTVCLAVCIKLCRCAACSSKFQFKGIVSLPSSKVIKRRMFLWSCSWLAVFCSLLRRKTIFRILIFFLFTRYLLNSSSATKTPSLLANHTHVLLLN